MEGVVNEFPVPQVVPPTCISYHLTSPKDDVAVKVAGSSGIQIVSGVVAMIVLFKVNCTGVEATVVVLKEQVTLQRY